MKSVGCEYTGAEACKLCGNPALHGSKGVSAPGRRWNEGDELEATATGR